MHRRLYMLRLQRRQLQFDQRLTICCCLLHLQLHSQQRLLWRLLLDYIQCSTQDWPV
jgi:hypothetical protein